MTSTTVTSEEQLAAAIEAKADYIEVRGDLAEKTFKIKAVGTVAWALAIGCIATAVTAVVLASKAKSATATTVATTSASLFATPALAMGPEAMTAAVAIASTGGVSALTKLRRYKQLSYRGDVLVLSRA
ncbi:hypothetical protein [Maricaulis maris]|uniref:hypothetical protein n=1 Tax=Maricaulis maris TaxID=74318 RepID=UPI003A9005B8